MSKNKKYGRSSDVFVAGQHRDAGTEKSRIVDISSTSLGATSKHSQGSLRTDQKSKKKSRRLTKAKRKQNRAS